MPKKTLDELRMELVGSNDPFADPVVTIFAEVARYMDLHDTPHRGVIMFALAMTWNDETWFDVMRDVYRASGMDGPKATAAFVAHLVEAGLVKEIIGAIQRRGTRLM